MGGSRTASADRARMQITRPSAGGQGQSWQGARLERVTIGFLHTAEVHKRTFTGLLDEISPGRPSTHIVDPALLVDARERGGVDDELRERLTARLSEAASRAAVVVCTCSTISGPAELLSSAVGVPIVRVDRPMAELAVKSGSRIAIVAALQSTIAPTVALLTEVAQHQGRTPSFDEVVLPDAWSLFEDGDLAAFATAIAAAVESLDPSTDVVVLAQASMAVAVPHCKTLAPVLSSPRSAVEAAVALAGQ